MRILVDVATDRLRADILDLLSRAGHEVERGAPSPGRAFDLALVGTPEVAETLRRERPGVAVIVVTQVGDVAARIRSLELGADDALDASFAPAQIAVRVGAAGRRAAMTPPAPERVDADGCLVDLAAATATRDGRTVPLTVREVDLVRYFAQHAGVVLSRADLLHHVWRVAPGNETRSVDVAMVGLRAKLERDPAHPAVIVSVRGAGYRWDGLTLG